MEERDGISTDEAMAMFSWANSDDFWRQNILFAGQAAAEVGPTRSEALKPQSQFY